MGTPFCDFTNRRLIDGKNHTTVTDLNHINFDDLFYSFIFQQSLIKICGLFPNYSLNYQKPYFMKYGHFFGRVTKKIIIENVLNSFSWLHNPSGFY